MRPLRLTSILFLVLAALRAPLFAGDPGPVLGNMIIFTLPQNSVQLSAISGESEKKIRDVCNELGRLLPVEKNRLDYALRALDMQGQTPDYETVARSLNVSVYILLSTYLRGNDITGEMKCVALDPLYKGMEKTVLVRSRVPGNIAVKLAKELVLLHRSVPVRARVRKDGRPGYLVEAGQWHGLSEGTWETDRGEVRVRAVSRYRSRLDSDTPLKEGDVLTIDLYPRVDRLTADLDRQIENNTLKRYGLANTLLKGDNAEARFIAATCIINPGANVCLPAYGSFLATEYMGFKNTSLHVPGFAASSFFLLNQFMLTEFLTGFNTNFFPWKQDGDKNNDMARLHMFLWCSLPFTVTAGYFDQLAWQMSRNRTLPAFFQYRDWTAVGLSLLFPGGGLMFKGRLIEGWGYYSSEMLLAGYGIYNLHNKKGRTSFLALGVIKALELLHAYFVGPGYSFYRYEKRGPETDVSLKMGIIPHEKEDVFRVGVVSGF